MLQLLLSIEQHSTTAASSTALCRLHPSRTADSSSQFQLYPRWRIPGSDRATVSKYSTSCSIAASWYSLHSCCCCLFLSSVLPSAQSVRKLSAVRAPTGCAPCIKHEESYVRMTNIRPHKETQGNNSIHSPRKKNLERTPREIQCLDRTQTSTTQCPDDLPMSTPLLSVLSKSAHTRRFDRKQTKISQV